MVEDEIDELRERIPRPEVWSGGDPLQRQRGVGGRAEGHEPLDRSLEFQQEQDSLAIDGVGGPDSCRGWRRCSVFLLTSPVDSSRSVEKSIFAAHSGAWPWIRISTMRRSAKTDLRKASCMESPGWWGLQAGGRGGGG